MYNENQTKEMNERVMQHSKEMINSYKLLISNIKGN
jgi:hypothetical protein